ncbi:MAG: Gfo/Idh/MocA family oxidoreductase [Planctomycetota bacterium]
MAKAKLSKADPIRTALVGLGDQGHGCLHAMRLMSEDFEIVGLSDKHQEVLKNLAKRYEVDRTTTDWKEFLDDETIDFMYFATPGDRHSENILESLRAGKHVYIEKPAANNINDCQTALELAQEKNLLVMVCMNVRHYWPNSVIKHALEEGMLGDIFYVQMDYIHDVRYCLMPDSPRFKKTYFADQQKANYFYEASCHPIDTLMWMFGPIARVWAQESEGIISRVWQGRLVPSDCVSVEVEFAKPNLIGRSLTLLGYCGDRPSKFYGITICGTQGSALPDGVFLVKDNPDYEQVHDPDRQVKLEYEKLGTEWGITTDPPVPYEYKPGDPSHVACHLKLLPRLVTAIRQGRRAVEPGLLSNAMVMSVMEACVRSLKTKNQEQVDYEPMQYFIDRLPGV